MAALSRPSRRPTLRIANAPPAASRAASSASGRVPGSTLSTSFLAHSGRAAAAEAAAIELTPGVISQANSPASRPNRYMKLP